MVTGIEVAGVAFGLFPIVIEGIECYISSAEKVKEMLHHRRTLDEFRRELEMEKSIFDNIRCTLEDRAGVLIEPNMEFPQKIMEEVLSCLPQSAVASFVNGCQELNTILRELTERFQKFEQDMAGYRKMFTMLQHFKKKDRDQCIERIHRLNSNLHKLVNGAPKTAANNLRINVAGHYQRVRDHAIILYSALKEGLQISSCPCKVPLNEKIPHSANLQLDVCILGTPNSKHNNHDTVGRRLSLLFPVPAEQSNTGYLTLRELEFENLENPKLVESSELSGPLLPYMVDQDPTTPPTYTASTASEQTTEPAKHPLSISSALGYVSNRLRSRSPFKKVQKKVGFCLPAAETRPLTSESSPVPSASERSRIIDCFCSTIRSITEVHTCVGILVSNKSKHQVWVPRAPLAILASARVVSLAELLSLPEPPMGERLKLAVRLASSVLQLHRTEWLQERWGKQDIYLVQGGSSKSRSPSLETPVVHQAFTQEPPVFEASMESRIIRCNLSLFSLGIVLVELWFWRSVESFQADEPQAYCGPQAASDTTIYATAERLIDELYITAGVNYGHTVRRCIRGIDHQETRLENNEFKNEVYLKVLQPLEKHLEFFCGKPLWEILGKRGT